MPCTVQGPAHRTLIVAPGGSPGPLIVSWAADSVVIGYCNLILLQVRTLSSGRAGRMILSPPCAARAVDIAGALAGLFDAATVVFLALDGMSEALKRPVDIPKPC